MINLPIKIGKSKELKGIRCIEASADIEKGEVIEECPLIFIEKSEWDDAEKTIVGSYKYAWDKERDCLVLGYCGLINHSYTPNADYERDYKTDKMKYIAIKDIKAGEEIFINYNGNPKSKAKLEDDYLNYKY
jgi:uncharacterized protein